MALRPKVSLALAACSVAVMPQVAAAQHITIDGRFSPAQTLVGPNYAITAGLGKHVGSNLFHSFGQFGLATGESAAFSGPATISNVIGRVTGGNPSSIDGRIQSNIAGANLYLINPSGVVFGPNATVNVLGSFHASTADYVKMSDGAKFQATNPDGSTLSAAPPAAFGFLTARPAAIAVNGSNLGPVPGTLGVVAGPVSITGATLSAPAGTIHVTSVASPGEVPVDPRNTSALTATSFGPVDIRGGSTLDVSDPKNLGSGGSVFIHAGALTIDASEINGDNYGSGPGGVLSLRGDSQITLSNNANVHAIAQANGTGADIVIRTSSGGGISIDNSIVAVGSIAAGDSGQLSVATGQLSLANGAAFRSDARDGSGNGGAITISAGSVALDGGGALDQSTGIFSTTTDVGRGGSITIVAGQLALRNGANVLATSCATPSCNRSVAGAVTGAGGGIAVSVDASVTIDSGASLGTVASAKGNAGDVSVTVAGPLTINMSFGADRSTFQGIGSQTVDVGNAGSVILAARSLAIVNNGEISSSSSASGKVGSVTITAFDKLTIDGSGAILPPAAGPTGIFSQVGRAGSGIAGNVSITTGMLSILNNGEISSSTFGSEAGNVTLAVSGQLTIDSSKGNPMANATGIFSQAGRGSSGDAGTLSISAGNLSIVNNGEIAGSTFSSGNAGRVSISVPGQLTIDGSGENIAAGRTGIFSQTNPGSRGNAGTVSVSAGTLVIAKNGVISSATQGSGHGGDVNITVASDIVLPDRGPQITAKSTGSGDAGSITVSATRLLMNNGAAISTEAATSTANGGNITLHIGDFLYLIDSQISTSVKGETGNGGNILIDPPLVILDHSLIKADAIAGHGGNIKIDADPFVSSSDSSVEATSERGVSGTVSVNGLVNANGALVVLSSQLRGRTEVLREACAARGDRPISSLVEAGRGGLPQDPEATLPALYIAGRDLNPIRQTAADPTEASGAMRTTVRLTMRCG